jgi:hypothetical protein
MGRIRPQTQARRIFDKFGGCLNLQVALKAVGHPRVISAIYRWDLCPSRPAAPVA